MRQYLDKYLNHLKSKQASKNTISSYERDLRYFEIFLSESGISKIDKINKTNIMAYVMSLQKKEKTTATIARNIASIHSFFRYLNTEGIISKDPSYEVDSPKVKKKLPEVLSFDEVLQLLNQPIQADTKGIRDKAMLEVLYATGIRVTELLSLKISDVDLNLSYIKCVEGRRERILPLNKNAAQALEIYLKDSRNKIVKDNMENTLFLNYAGAPMSRQGFWKIVKNYAECANINKKITPHLIRYSFAVHLVENGADLQSVQEILGYSDISTTNVYAQINKTTLKDVYAKTHPRY